MKRELTTTQVKFVIDKIYDSGAIWLCFTGGDPLTRPDFLDIYSYAKDKGFLITIFTNAYSMSKRIANYLKKRPPFVIEITLNAISKKLYEFISQIKGSYDKTTEGLNLILERNLPLKIKTQMTKDNLKELPKIKEFIEKLGLNFRPSAFLHARLDGDLFPCSLRIRPEEVIRLDRRVDLDSIKEECGSTDNQANEQNGLNEHNGNNRLNVLNKRNDYLFRCAIGGGDGIHIDPYGNIIPCNCIREPKMNLLKESIEGARRNILDWVRGRKVNADSKCKNCSIKDLCYNCSGKALLETGNLEGQSEWCCELAHLIRRGYPISS